jgi:hypothetical protein
MHWHCRDLRLFPSYLFGFCITALLARGDIDEARNLVETGPAGPRFMLTAFDPSRTVFHISEATAYSAMVGHYFLSTDRPQLAEVQLQMLEDTAPDSPQTQILAQRIERIGSLLQVKNAVARLAAKAQAKRSKARQPARPKKRPKGIVDAGPGNAGGPSGPGG